MKIHQIVVFTLEDGEIFLRLKANWADGKTMRERQKILESFRKALNDTTCWVNLGIDQLKRAQA